MKLKPARRITGTLTIPGDKSISHRVAMIAAQADGVSRFSNFATSQDCRSTIDCLRALGVNIELINDSYIIEGKRQFWAPSEPLDCGNSGTTMRVMSGVLAAQNFSSTLVGDDSLSKRPMRRIIEPLKLMGVVVDSNDGRPPLVIKGTPDIKPMSYRLPIASAQVKSAVLFAGMNARGRTEVIETTKSRDHTERLFSDFGIPVRVEHDEAWSISVDGPVRPQSRDMKIPGDASSAAYFVAAAMFLPESDLLLEGVGLNPTRIEYLSVLRSHGADIIIEDHSNNLNEPVGNVRVRAGYSKGTNDTNIIGGDKIPSLIDELPLLAVVGSQLPGGLTIRDAGELRHKETDRLRATASNLRAMGAEVEELADGLEIDGPVKLKGATIDSFGDHRIAMAFSIAALMADGDSYIAGSDCVNISFPEFFQLLHSITAYK